MRKKRSHYKAPIRRVFRGELQRLRLGRRRPQPAGFQELRVHLKLWKLRNRRRSARRRKRKRRKKKRRRLLKN